MSAGSTRASSDCLAAQGRRLTLRLGFLSPSSGIVTAQKGVRNVSRDAECCAGHQLSPRSTSCDPFQLDSFLASSLNLDPESSLLLGVTTS